MAQIIRIADQIAAVSDKTAKTLFPRLRAKNLCYPYGLRWSGYEWHHSPLSYYKAESEYKTLPILSFSQFINQLNEHIALAEMPVAEMEEHMAVTEIKQVTQEVYTNTADAVVVSKHFNSLIQDNFFGKLFLKANAKEILDEAKAREAAEKEKK